MFKIFGSFFINNMFALFYQIDQQIQSLFKSKKSIKAKGDAPVLPNASGNQNEEAAGSTNANDTASKLELAKKAAARQVLIFFRQDNSNKTHIRNRDSPGC